MTSHCPLLPREPIFLEDKFTLSAKEFSPGEFPISTNSAASFFKSIDISPDGSQVLSTTSESNLISIHSISSELIASKRYYVCKNTNGLDHIDSDGSLGEQFSPPFLTPQLKLIIGESIYDTKWYPFMNASTDPNSCCFISTSRGQPIHLFDANVGSLRCSYTAYDAFDELDTANCLAFNLQGDKIYAGFNRMIRSFDVNYPGKNYFDIPTCKSRKDYLGQKGLISAIAFNPDHSKCYAAGSYANSVAVYVEGMQGSALEIRDALVGGVTQVKWSNCGSKIWIGGRNNSYITCWDVRSARCEVGRIERLLSTNQRMRFDIDPWGEYLITGTQDGKVLFYSTESFELINSITTLNINSEFRNEDKDVCKDEVNTKGGDNKSINGDCVHSTVFHPYSALVLTSTGQRHFHIDTDSSDTEEDESKDSSKAEGSFWSCSGIQVWSVAYDPIEIPKAEETSYDESIVMSVEETTIEDNRIMLLVDEESVMQSTIDVT